MPKMLFTLNQLFKQFGCKILSFNKSGTDSGTFVWTPPTRLKGPAKWLVLFLGPHPPV